jgi:hypothetical protein
VGRESAGRGEELTTPRDRQKQKGEKFEKGEKFQKGEKENAKPGATALSFSTFWPFLPF